jgi:hypothetical protein
MPACGAPDNKFWSPELIFNFGMYMVPPEVISMAYFINSHPPVTNITTEASGTVLFHRRHYPYLPELFLLSQQILKLRSAKFIPEFLVYLVVNCVALWLCNGTIYILILIKVDYCNGC